MNIESDSIKFGIGVKIWCGLCIFSNLITLLSNFSWLLLIAALVIICPFILLLKHKRRYALYLMFFLNIILILIVSIWAKYSVLSTIILLLRSMLPPFITYIILLKYWPNMK